MVVNCFQILQLDVTFYLEHVQKVVLNVLIKMKTRIYAAPAIKGLTPKLNMVNKEQHSKEQQYSFTNAPLLVDGMYHIQNHSPFMHCTSSDELLNPISDSCNN